MPRIHPDEMDEIASEMADRASIEETVQVLGEAFVFGREGCLLKEAVHEALAEAVEAAVVNSDIDEDKINVQAIVASCRANLAAEDRVQEALRQHYFNDLW
jgi:hypothetical protein